ncbi:response regulator [Aliikangiella maris]|uniref:Response regulator transcription factor n=2 Tax=Aliikangiella maris TaxID=3162458 RepID=A0ABV2BXM3_9GAMM
MNLLIADDDIELCQLLKDYLSQENFDVECVYDGESAITKISQQSFDLLILDVMMPLKSGFETLTEIRRNSALPIIMLTARGEKIDRIVGLEMGADDYLAKPCDPRELVARIRAVTRRTQASILTSNPTTVLTINRVCLDPTNRQVTLNQQMIDLTSTEFDLLKILMENAGKLVSRDAISENCLGKKLQPFDRSIDMHLSNVRKKLGAFSPQKPRIKTIRGSGYQYLVWPEK